MGNQEFSDEFDVLFNNVTSNQGPGLNEYEKSVFLTKGQSQLVREYFNGRVDSVGGGFDGSQKRQYDFSCLIRTEPLFNVNSYADRITGVEKVDRRSEVFLFPENYFLSVNEILWDDRWQYSVLPIDYQEYQRLMLKPYNFPVKRGAWRLITDKKNCNSWREYVKVGGKDSQTDYSFLSSWADQKRKLQVTISSHEAANADAILAMVGLSEGTYPYTTYINDGTADRGQASKHNAICFLYGDNPCVMQVGKGWQDGMTYTVDVVITCIKSLDDEEVAEAIQEGFRQYAGMCRIHTEDTVLAKVARHTDGFANLQAPSQFEGFMSGKTFTTGVIQLPMAEVIGKFKGELHYQLRYVRTLRPIVLDDLSNYGEGLTIDGVGVATECELPKETHEEILERAVTLAKIAWQGGTLTQARNSNNQ